MLSFLADKISERPALPKDVIILPAIPVTAVGKIFKPELKCDQAKYVYSNELADLSKQGIQSKVEVYEDKIHGTIVDVSLEDGSGIDKTSIEQEVAAMLNRYQMITVNINWVG